VSTSSADADLRRAVTLTATVAAASGTTAPALGSVQFYVTNKARARRSVRRNHGYDQPYQCGLHVVTTARLQAGSGNAIRGVHGWYGLQRQHGTNSVSETVTPVT